MKHSVVAAFVLVSLAVAGLAYWLVDLGRDEPTHQASVEQGAPADAVISDAALVDVVLPTRFSAQAEAGQELFEANCASCHGTNAAGRDGAGPPLIHIIYETGHHGDPAFYQAVRAGVRAHHWRFGNMPAIEGVSQSDVSDIVAYIRDLQRANGIF